MSVFARLPCCLSRDNLIREFLHIYLRTSFGGGNFKNRSATRVSFFRKCLKFNVDLKNAEKNWEKRFCFWDKCIWIVCIELSPLRTEYLSSAVNVLTKSLKTFHVTKMDFFNSISFRVINVYGKGAGIKIESVFRPVYHATCRRVISNESF